MSQQQLDHRIAQGGILDVLRIIQRIGQSSLSEVMDVEPTDAPRFNSSVAMSMAWRPARRTQVPTSCPRPSRSRRRLALALSPPSRDYGAIEMACRSGEAFRKNFRIFFRVNQLQELGQCSQRFGAPRSQARMIASDLRAMIHWTTDGSRRIARTAEGLPWMRRGIHWLSDLGHPINAREPHAA